ncbi:MAG: antirestriction protein [Bacteroidota bacterium]|nr:antirestriction protein [Bacteroidota bacterium]
METSKVNVINEVTVKLVALLDKVSNGDIEYWIPLSGLAYNPVTKHTYNSLNQLLLSFALQKMHYNHNNWLSFKQINEAGGTVNKGEKSTLITFTDVLYFDKDNNKLSAQEAIKKAQIENAGIRKYKDIAISTKRFLKYYYVFNVAQTNGLPAEIIAPDLVKLLDKDRFDMADEIAHENGVLIKHVSGNSAHYEVTNDIIQMPFLKQFKSTENYYATRFHEITHWTGNEKRLNRSFRKKGSPEYAFEELIAELGSTFMCAHLQIKAPLTSSAAYVKSWLSALENDRTYILKAVSHAERAVQFLLKKQTISV